MARRTLLVDGDTLIYAAASASEYEAQWSEWLFTYHADFAVAQEALVSRMEHIADSLNVDEVVMALSDGANWRKRVMPEYKEHRKKTRKPIVYGPLRDFAAERWRTYQKPALEGDDVLGIIATTPRLFPGEKIIVSIDKDMKTIPGLHVNYAKAGTSGSWEDDIMVVTEAEADVYHLTQTLTGDRTDGYPGCPGVGAVSAEKILGDSPSWEKVVAAYAKAGLSEAVALQNARVARICRASDWDSKKQEVILWNP